MPPQLALFLCVLFVLWMFIEERKVRGKVSAALWIPLIWAFILGSRPVSQWLGVGEEALTMAEKIEGSPLDRAVLFALIAAGVAVLLRRRADISGIAWSNKWIFAFYIFLAISILWSDYSFVSFKRWIKDFGNIVMALVVLSEANPVEAFKSLMLRCSFLLIPFSVVAIKYFPETSRYYDRWNYSAYFSGIAVDKNLLGMMLFVCGVFLVQAFLDSGENGLQPKKFRFALILLLLMTFWMLLKAHSATALVCTVLATVSLVVIRRAGARKFLLCSLVFATLSLFILSTVNIPALFGDLLGRDTTLTGRTEIWNNLLDEKVNPLIGVGFYSFWLGDRTAKLSEKYHYELNEAHNGYLETYLNSGIIGLLLLLAIIGAALRSTWQGLNQGDRWAAYRFAFIMGTVLYNISEVTVNRLSLIWFTFLLVALTYPPQREPLVTSTVVKHKYSPRTSPHIS